MNIKHYFLIIGFCFNSLYASAQVNETYSFAESYLYRMAQKGIINIQDYVLPLDRKDISVALDSIQLHQNRLSAIEKKELVFLQQEFYWEKNADTNADKPLILKKDIGKRWRFLGASVINTKIFIDPLAETIFSSYGKSYNITTFGGARVYGSFGKHMGFNIAFKDVTERGDSIDYTKSFTPETGVLNTSRNINQLNYSTLNFNLAYKWKNGMLSVGNDNLNWGYGMGGKLILSSKPPSFPYIKLDYSPFKWLHFNYFNAWLKSNIIDSARSYNTGTGVVGSYRDVFVSKFLAFHSISFLPTKGLEIAIGESMMYSDNLDVGYLVPINLFKIYDQHTSNYDLAAGSNAQIFGQISSRNQIKNTHIYLDLFIDELLFSKIFNKQESRNQLGYTFGINKTDFLVNYLTLGIEYTRINPFVYNNAIPAQTYKHSSYVMGDWMGSNADRLYLFTEYTPAPKLKLKAVYQSLRKGSEGTLSQQYQQPQPDFLFGSVLHQKDVWFNISYEYLNRLNFYLKMNYTSNSFEKTTENRKSISVGFIYGL